ncbi:hypothetical protein AB0J86_13930 [Micromonospora sp. NPDC049559]|uniref:hypothetical protein n=1 Tax=Micromonospora sp. NPDC049559 TaxID=3155923 RepID=UPI003431AFAC
MATGMSGARPTGAGGAETAPPAVAAARMGGATADPAGPRAGGPYRAEQERNRRRTGTPAGGRTRRLQ